MSEWLDLLLNLICGLLEILCDFNSFGSSNRSWPDLENSRIFWGIVILILGGIIWWELG